MPSQSRGLVELYLFLIILLIVISSESHGYVIRNEILGRKHLHSTTTFSTLPSNKEDDDPIISNSPNTKVDSFMNDPPNYRSDFRKLFNLKSSSVLNRQGGYEIDTRTEEKEGDDFQQEKEQRYLQLNQTSWDFSESDYAIDSFLRGEYDRPFAEDAAAPTPDFSPSQTVEIALENLRRLNKPDVSHGAAVFMRFCCPLSRNDRWGGSSSSLSHWKQIVRGALTPTMLARRIRSSQEFSALLDWTRLDTTEGMSVPESRRGMESSVAFVNAALYLGTGISPTILQVTLRKLSGVWLIENISNCQENLFTTIQNDSL